MTEPAGDAPASDWFRTLLDTAEEIYFRYNLVPSRGFVYLSPSVRALTGHDAEAFYADPALCLRVIARDDRHVLRQALRARRALELTVRLDREQTRVPILLRIVAVVRSGRVLALEGVARLASGDGGAATESLPENDRQPTPQRLAALMYEVHELLHRVLPPRDGRRASDPTQIVRIGDLAFDLDRLSVTESGTPVSLTSRELMVLRYLMLRPGRVVTRSQLLTDVWGYQYTGDDRTVDVHVSRLRRKLPSLNGRLLAIKHLGYRLDVEQDSLHKSAAG
jgi:DNA-binding winged helix-turn-helix (wHTH) protein